MSEGLVEITKPTTSKGSHYHKAYYAYSGMVEFNSTVSINSGELLIEINSFANPYPREKRRVSSFVYDFLSETEQPTSLRNMGLTHSKSMFLTNAGRSLKRLCRSFVPLSLMSRCRRSKQKSVIFTIYTIYGMMMNAGITFSATDS